MADDDAYFTPQNPAKKSEVPVKNDSNYFDALKNAPAQVATPKETVDFPHAPTPPQTPTLMVNPVKEMPTNGKDRTSDEVTCSMDDMGKKSLEQHQWFHDAIPLEDVKLLLINEGDFLLRRIDLQTRKTACVSTKYKGDIHNFAFCATETRLGRFSYSLTGQQSADSAIDIVTLHMTSRTPVFETCKLITPVPKQEWELSADRIRMLNKVGEGQFGEVFRGHLMLRNGSVSCEVAVKLVKSTVDKKVIVKMQEEARLMRKYRHINIVHMHGVIFSDQQTMIVMEFIKGGALNKYVRENPQILPLVRASFCHNVAAGLAYLHKQNCMHRDVAARNCLVTEDGKCVKISDFGLSVHGKRIQLPPNEMVAVRWVGPEVLKDRIYMRESDVWSYGMLCWEIYNDGKEPFLEFEKAYIRENIRKIRPTMQFKAPPEVIEAMKNCWDNDPCARPKMQEIEEELRKFCLIKLTEESRKENVKDVSGLGKLVKKFRNSMGMPPKDRAQESVRRRNSVAAQNFNPFKKKGSREGSRESLSQNSKFARKRSSSGAKSKPISKNGNG